MEDSEKKKVFFASDVIPFNWKPLYKDEALIRKKYLEEKASVAKLAKLCSCSKATMRKYLLKFGIRSKN